MPLPAEELPSSQGSTGGGGHAEHLFLVHSHITYLVAMRVMNFGGLDPQRVAFLTPRSYRAPDTATRQIPVSYEAVPASRRERRDVRRGWYALRVVDGLLADLTGGRSFHLYTPQTMQPLVQVLKSHPRCEGFSFLEEGLNSYCTRTEIERTHPPPSPLPLWQRIAYRNRLRTGRFFDEGHCRAYGVSPETFPGMDNRVVLDDVIPPASPEQAAGVETVLVLDALSVHRRVRLESVLTALRRVLGQVKSGGISSMHYKFHPAQLGTEEVTAVETVLAESGISAHRLADDISLEGLARAKPDTRYFVNLSSIGLYAAHFGCPVFSYAQWVAQAEPEFARFIAFTPRVFLDRVELLSS